MARRGYSKSLPSFFSKAARSLYRCRPPEPPWCFAARSYRAARDAESCLAGFKLEIAKMRSEGAMQVTLTLCSMSSKRFMRLTTMMRASSLWQFSGKLLGSPASGHKRIVGALTAPHRPQHQKRTS